MNHTVRFACLTTAMWLASSATFAQTKGIDCRVPSMDDKPICASPELLKLRQQVDQLTIQIQHQLTGIDADIVRDTQVPLQIEVNDCHAESECIANVLRKRISILQDAQANPDSIQKAIRQYKDFYIPEILKYGDLLLGAKVSVAGSIQLSDRDKPPFLRTNGVLTDDVNKGKVKSSVPVRFVAMSQEGANFLDEKGPFSWWNGTVERQKGKLGLFLTDGLGAALLVPRGQKACAMSDLDGAFYFNDSEGGAQMLALSVQNRTLEPCRLENAPRVAVSKVTDAPTATLTNVKSCWLCKADDTDDTNRIKSKIPMELEPGATAHFTLRWKTEASQSACMKAASMTITLGYDPNYFYLRTSQRPLNVCQTIEISDYQTGAYPGTPVADAVVQGMKLTATPVAVPPETPNPRKIVVAAAPSSLRTGGCPELYLYVREADSKTVLSALRLNSAGEYTADPSILATAMACADGPWPAHVTVLDTVHDERDQTAIVWRALGVDGEKVFLAASYRLVPPGGSEATQEDDAYARCKQYVQTPIPKADKLATMSLDAMECNSEALYDGVDEVPDYQKARACAYRERDAGLDQVTPFRGADILAMIYANGKGIPQNLALARRFVCETVGRDTYHLLNELAPAEEAKQTVSSREISADDTSQFDICDSGNAGPTAMFDECSARTDLIDESQYAAKIMPIAREWPSQQRDALREMLRVTFTFFSARTTEFPDEAPKGSAVISSADALDYEERDFLKTLRAFDEGKLPPDATTAQFAHADAALNQAFKSALHRAPEEYEYSHKYQFTRDSLRTTQRTWIRYRDQWITFAHLKYPQLSDTAWRTWLTLERTRQLEKLP